MTTKILIEDILRNYTHGFGFRLKWEIQSYCVNVKAYEITSYDVDDYSKIFFHTKNDQSRRYGRFFGAYRYDIA